MTDRDEHRAKCIEAGAMAAHRAYYNNYTTINGPVRYWEFEPYQGRWIDAQTAAFDALHGLAWVVAGPISSSDVAELLDSLDLTNAPEQKP